MEISVNGRKRQLDDGESVGQLLRSLALEPRFVLVERNKTLVDKGLVEGTMLEDGDVVELFQMVGGG